MATNLSGSRGALAAWVHEVCFGRYAGRFNFSSETLSATGRSGRVSARFPGEYSTMISSALSMPVAVLKLLSAPAITAALPWASQTVVQYSFAALASSVDKANAEIATSIFLSAPVVGLLFVG